ncbi:23S rRNA (guanosine(2251)-2'-O)-methyltransferase RlmB [Lutispora saccharofermentans]|uniref:23S rRNA (guanosine(2251)-2'-O)-methyltransferase RlmB n=1 Tax=Lutispora saccharofermentans TaxID=3024236 RepID=UPI0026EB0187|nr:23S rRNA (guanosine(2251)-2'-O)-methyltransferase RlmB [Lutispora saccharofermentans]
MPFGGEKRNKADKWGKKVREDKKTPKFNKPVQKKTEGRAKPQYIEEAEDRDDYYINLIEGRNPVLEALKSGREIDKLFVQSGQLEGSIRQIIAIARDKKILIKEVDKAKLDRMSATKSHQGVIASAALYKYYEVDDILEIAKEKAEDPFIVILDEITDPQNLGSILRSCDGAGVHGVIIPKRRAASLTPIIGKISAGAVEYVPVAKVTNLNQTMDYLKEKGLWIAGADASGDPYYEKDMTGPLALVVGSEGKGLGKLIKENCDFIVGIPMAGKISSLNAAVSCAVVIFEAKKQRALKNAAGSLQDGSIH